MVGKSDFYDDLVSILDSWINASTDALANESANLIWTDQPECFERVRSALKQSEISHDDLEQIFREVIVGVLISTLTTFDGGTALAQKGSVRLVDESGQMLSNDLHNEFASYLIETGRLEP